MPPQLPTSFPSRSLSRVRILRLLLIGWPAHTTAADCRVYLSTVYNYAKKNSEQKSRREESYY